MELVEIKKGKTGTGLLIENDGFVTMSKKAISSIKEDIGMGDEWYVPNPFIVDAVFQKFGIKNANGRIYPENVLKREVEKYQEAINEKRALGECYTPDVLILTEKGWKELKDVQEGENIITLNTENGNVEINPIKRKIEKDFDGEMIRIKGRNIDELVTPNHGFPIYDRHHKFSSFKTAEELLESDNLSHYYIPKQLDKGFCDRLIEAKNSHPMNFSLRALTKGIYLDKRFITIEKEQYKGKVMCVEVDNHTWYVMSNGKCHWTKNCNHPEQSTIDLSRVSHNIIELHWEGRTLVGKMEINTSEGFRKQGIVTTCGDQVANLLLNGYKIGVSSRGVGSVEQKLGQYIVGDDFELLCWDVVSNPSTPGAWIGKQEELTAYMESDSSHEGKSEINEKISKIKEILKS